MMGDKYSSGPVAATRILEWTFCIALVGIVTLIGLLNLAFPFVADQAVAMIAAKTISDGGILYVDFWDNKMPGLFWFYYLAGELFGYTEIGVHTLELIWMTCFSVTLVVALRGYFRHSWLAGAVPVMTVGAYYAGVEMFALTQVEMLVTFPVFASAWCAFRGAGSARHASRFYFASGLTAGVTVVFKLVFAPLLVVFWLIASLHLAFVKRETMKTLVIRVWIPVSAGVISVLVLTAMYFWINDALDELLWTAFVYPPQALKVAPAAQYNQLAESILFFATYFGAASGFIAFAVREWWRDNRNLFTSLLIAWIVIGFVLILIQRFSWWPYHFLLLFAPAGILAIRGVDDLLVALEGTDAARKIGSRWISVVLVISAMGAIAIPVGQKMEPYIKVFVRKGGTVDSFQKALSKDYRRIQRSTRFLSDETALQGRVYIFGDPLYYHLSGRRPAAPIIGWPWNYFLQSQWEDLTGQLDKTRPVYIYIDALNKKYIDLRGGGVKEYIEERYLGLISDPGGKWYILKPEYRK